MSKDALKGWMIIGVIATGAYKLGYKHGEVNGAMEATATLLSSVFEGLSELKKTKVY